MKSRRILKEQRIVLEIRDAAAPMFGGYIETTREKLRKLRERLKRR